MNKIFRSDIQVNKIHGLSSNGGYKALSKGEPLICDIILDNSSTVQTVNSYLIIGQNNTNTSFLNHGWTIDKILPITIELTDDRYTFSTGDGEYTITSSEATAYIKNSYIILTISPYIRFTDNYNTWRSIQTIQIPAQSTDVLTLDSGTTYFSGAASIKNIINLRSSSDEIDAAKWSLDRTNALSLDVVDGYALNIHSSSLKDNITVSARFKNGIQFSANDSEDTKRAISFSVCGVKGNPNTLQLSSENGLQYNDNSVLTEGNVPFIWDDNGFTINRLYWGYSANDDKSPKMSGLPVLADAGYKIWSARIEKNSFHSDKGDSIGNDSYICIYPSNDDYGMDPRWSFAAPHNTQINSIVAIAEINDVNGDTPTLCVQRCSIGSGPYYYKIIIDRYTDKFNAAHVIAICS